MHPAKRKGDASEREVAAILSDELGVTVKRALGAGRQQDVGDMFGIPDTVVQVANYKDVARAIREKLPEAERQRVNAGARFAAVFVRRPGGAYVVCMSPEQWCLLVREAVFGSEEKAA